MELPILLDSHWLGTGLILISNPTRLRRANGTHTARGDFRSYWVRCKKKNQSLRKTVKPPISKRNLRYHQPRQPRATQDRNGGCWRTRGGDCDCDGEGGSSYPSSEGFCFQKGRLTHPIKLVLSTFAHHHCLYSLSKTYTLISQKTSNVKFYQLLNSKKSKLPSQAARPPT